ncbi:MAG TPA: type II toxin-antitoxin system MqsA family antitoxin [Herbaspirillum sp.]|uniref:type II toxin-antitoxin system MqsA family antitoxin n=1 Tax=Herbaspirillum sp. TaxID=1890675 RepID=UPI002D741F68|nr:type II toxin-antitoxin system MqsA family antitoxin [Herbaspirillum sp.]HZG19281.1 type II toxin-antitoxin system MqsA family antitoxin [Herbaspirillum sp.]
MKCPSCGGAELVRDTRNLTYIYKGESTVIEAVTGNFCPACGEVLLNREQGDRYSALIGQFQRRINAAYVDPDYIARVRRKLDLDQRQAAELFGGGVNAFSRYENGKTQPPLALVKLFRLLDRHPDLLEEIRTA